MIKKDFVDVEGNLISDKVNEKMAKKFNHLKTKNATQMNINPDISHNPVFNKLAIQETSRHRKKASFANTTSKSYQIRCAG